MDLRARLYYMDLYARSPRRPPGDRYPSKVLDVDEAHLADEIRAVISRVEDQLVAAGGPRLREDARCVLLLNGQHMIAQPIIETGRFSEGELMGVLQNDIAQVVRRSAQEWSGPPPDAPEADGISGYQIIDSLAKERDQLQTSRFAFWNT